MTIHTVAVLGAKALDHPALGLADYGQGLPKG
jgi:hypothetical protein